MKKSEMAVMGMLILCTLCMLALGLFNIEEDRTGASNCWSSIGRKGCKGNILNLYSSIQFGNWIDGMDLFMTVAENSFLKGFILKIWRKLACMRKNILTMLEQ